MTLEDRIDIQASPERVWQVTVDVERWPQWSPAMQKLVREDVGEFRTGSAARIKQKAMPWARWVVTALEPGRSFTWQTRVPGMAMIATHHILPAENGVTSVLQLEMQGALARLLAPLLKPAVRHALKAENLGLKRYCEVRV